MLQYFGSRLSLLAPTWNYRPYWPQPKVGEEQPRILHWHGIKPGPCLSCILKHRLKGAAVDKECKPPTCIVDYLTLWHMVKDNGEHYIQSLMEYLQLLHDVMERPAMDVVPTHPVSVRIVD